MIPIWRACFESCKDAILNYVVSAVWMRKWGHCQDDSTCFYYEYTIVVIRHLSLQPCSSNISRTITRALEKIYSVRPSSVERDMVIGRKNWWPFSVARTGSFLQRYQYSRKVTWNVSRKMDLLKGSVTTATKKLDSEGSQQQTLATLRTSIEVAEQTT